MKRKDSPRASVLTKVIQILVLESAVLRRRVQLQKHHVEAPLYHQRTSNLRHAAIQTSPESSSIHALRDELAMLRRGELWHPLTRREYRDLLRADLDELEATLEEIEREWHG